MSETIRTETISPLTATEILSSYAYGKQRNVTAGWVNYLVEEMQANSFKQNTLIEFAVCSNPHRKVLIDGYHRLSAVAKSGMPQRFIILETQVDTQEAIDRLYYRIDRGMTKGVADQLRALGIQDVFKLTTTETRRLAAAVAFLNSGFAYPKRLHPDEHETLVREYGEECRLYFDVTAGKMSEMKTAIERSSTLSVGLATFRFSAKKLSNEMVEGFWRGVSLDDSLSADDPRKIAHRHLLTTRVGRPFDMPGVRTVSAAYSARVIAHCFNAYVQSKKMRNEPKPSIGPMNIVGSPFNGK